MRLETQRLIIRSAGESDEDMMFEAWNSPYVLRYNPMKPFSREKARETVEKDMKSDKAFYLEEKESGKAIGTVYLEEDSLRYRVNSHTLSYFLLEAYAGKGYMTEALRAVIAHAFETMGLDVLDVRIFAENKASLRLMEKLGFVREGELRRAIRGDGDIVYNDVLFSMLREEFFQGMA